MMKRSVISILILVVLLVFPFYSYAEDTTAPDTTITSGPSGEIDYRDVTFEWTGSDNVTSTSDLIYSYQLEGVDSDWSNWTYDKSRSYSELSHGEHTFKVRAKDNNGNIDETPAIRAFSITILEPGMKKWIFKHSDSYYGEIRSHPAVGPDGTVYVGIYGGLFYALGQDGKVKWSFHIGDIVSSSPAIASDDTIYMGSDMESNDAVLFAINPDGTKKWEFETEGEYISSPLIASDGTIYVSADSLYAINPNGTKEWTLPNAGNAEAIGKGGTIYLIVDKGIQTVSPEGTKKWTFKTKEYTPSRLAIGSDGTIYFSASYMGQGRRFYAINPDGTKKWVFKRENMSYVYPAIGPDGAIYLGSYDGNLYAINPDGTKKWIYQTESSVTCSPSIGKNGTIYVGSRDGTLYAIKSDGNKKWVFKTGDCIDYGTTIGSDGTIYLGRATMLKGTRR